MALFALVLTRTIERQNEDTNEVNMQKTHTLCLLCTKRCSLKHFHTKTLFHAKLGETHVPLGRLFSYFTSGPNDDKCLGFI